MVNRNYFGQKLRFVFKIADLPTQSQPLFHGLPGLFKLPHKYLGGGDVGQADCNLFLGAETLTDIYHLIHIPDHAVKIGDSRTHQASNEIRLGDPHLIFMLPSQHVRLHQVLIRQLKLAKVQQR